MNLILMIGRYYINMQNNRENLYQILMTLICLLFILCGLLVSCFEEKSSTYSKALVYDDSATDIPEESENVDYSENTIIPCWDFLIFKANTKEQAVYFYNPAENKGINFKITLLLRNEILYESRLIPPGKQITYIEIYRELEPLTESATVLYECFSDDGCILNGSKMNFTLKVEE